MRKVRNICDHDLTIEDVVVKVGEEKLVRDVGLVDYLRERGELALVHEGVKIHEKSELELLPMKELRKIGSELGAKDTSKSELINEIINKEKDKYG